MTGTSLAEDLQHLGAGRIEALLVAHLVQHGATSTADIMAATGLRQPEVSVGMRQLRERNWVRTRPLPREGKGRPMHGYELAISSDTLAAHYKEVGQQQVETYLHAMADLDQALSETA